MKGESKEWSFYRDRVKIRIEGFKIDRLIAKAVKGGTLIKEMQIVSETEAVGWISRKELKKLRKYAKSLYKITIISERGPQSALRRFSKKHILIGGSILVIFLVIFQSNTVYSVHIDGYRGIPEDELRLCLERQGIVKGAYIPKIAWQKARDTIFYTFPQITWVQLVYDGRVVHLNISETDHKLYGDFDKYAEGMEEDQDEAGLEQFFIPSERPETFCNIVADRPCKIDKITPIWGAVQVKAGDYVDKGQTLISGYIPIEATTYKEGWPTEYYVRAEGDVWAIAPYRLTFLQERYVQAERLERQRQGNQANPENQANQESDRLSDSETISNKVEKTEEEATAKVNQQIRVWAKENLPKNYEIINKGLKFTYKKNIIEVGVSLEVRQQIGIEQEITIGEETTDRNADR